ncbi:MFS transporter [Chamaesiphon minutus]|uniref:Arabinose efflux permease family protein n=1 Tax=Chamaesiphon minutus (strain ATCC 27169 / PCC 6605) TaxID=1173020 RepID=K9UDX8_CHAP6|nr:MFS transporter [Chamaesiphon minutus]AFY92641.1 arabinose efflux permease family protein [Chamaesiphon minutus PCC 6605]
MKDPLILDLESQSDELSQFISTKNPLHDRNFYIIISLTLIEIMGGPTIGPLLPELSKIFDVSPSEIQLVMAAYFLPIGIATPILGIVADRIGMKKVLVPSLLLFAIAGSSCAFASDFQTLIGWRFLQGLGSASLNLLALTLISALYRGKALVLAMSINVSAIGASTAIYPILGGVLAGFSWRYPFLLATIAFPMLLLVLMVLKLPRQPSGSQKIDLKIYLQKVWQSISNSTVLGLLLVIGVMFLIQSGPFITYIPILAGFNFGASGLFIGLVLASMSVSLGLVASQLPRLARHASEITLIKLAFAIAAISLSIIPLIDRAWLLFVPSILFGVALALAIPASHTLLAKLTIDDTRAGFMAVNASVQSFGFGLGPLIAGIFAGLWGMHGVFWATAGLAVATFALFHFLLSQGIGDRG